LKSFWEGVSIEGDQLRMVIVAKVPFPLKGDPIHQAKKALLETEGYSSFQTFQMLDVPAMIMDMKQGTGRLLRTMKDYGVVAILDSKIGKDMRNPRAYANALINSLPYTIIVDKIELVSQFMEALEKA
jgi:ATP-dependent DNA helicase DinG